MLEIYNPIVTDSHTSFEFENPSIEEFGLRLHKYLEELPWIVYEENGRVLGYAYAVQVRGRVAYSWSAELSVYVRPENFGQGIGKLLYTALMKLLKYQGIKNYYAVIALPNDTSEEFHHSLGFEKIAVFQKIGYKRRWIDIAWYLLRESGDEAPERRLPMTQVIENFSGILKS